MLCSCAKSSVCFIHDCVEFCNSVDGSSFKSWKDPISRRTSSSEACSSCPIVVSCPPCWRRIFICEIPCCVCKSMIPMPLYCFGRWTAYQLIFRAMFIFGSADVSNGLMMSLHCFFVSVVAGRQYSRDFVIVVWSANIASPGLRYPFLSLSPHCLAFFVSWIACSFQFPLATMHTPIVSRASCTSSWVNFWYYFCLFLT